MKSTRVIERTPPLVVYGVTLSKSRAGEPVRGDVLAGD